MKIRNCIFHVCNGGAIEYNSFWKSHCFNCSHSDSRHNTHGSSVNSVISYSTIISSSNSSSGGGGTSECIVVLVKLVVGGRSSSSSNTGCRSSCGGINSVIIISLFFVLCLDQCNTCKCPRV